MCSINQECLCSDNEFGQQAAAKELFAELDRSAAPVLPLRFLVQLRASFPQFAEMTTTGMYKQQDAEECWTQLLYSLRERLQVCKSFGSAHCSCNTSYCRMILPYCCK